MRQPVDQVAATAESPVAVTHHAVGNDPIPVCNAPGVGNTGAMAKDPDSDVRDKIRKVLLELQEMLVARDYLGIITRYYAGPVAGTMLVRLVTNHDDYVRLVDSLLDDEEGWMVNRDRQQVSACWSADIAAFDQVPCLAFHLRADGQWWPDALPESSAAPRARQQEQQEKRQRATTLKSLAKQVERLGGTVALPLPRTGGTAAFPGGIRLVVTAQWPTDVTYAWPADSGDVDGDDFPVLWGMTFNKDLLALAGTGIDVKDCEDRNLYCFAHADGGNYLLLIDTADAHPLDPVVYKIDHHDPGQDLRELGPLSLVLENLRPETDGDEDDEDASDDDDE